MFITKNEHGYYEVQVIGRDKKRKRFSLHVRSLQEAEEIISNSRVREIEKAAQIGILNEAVMSTLATGVRAMTVSDAVVHWKAWMELRHLSPMTVANTTTHVYAWAKTMGDPDKITLSSVKEEDIDRWLNDPSSTRKISTRIKMSMALRQFFRFVQSKGWKLGNPADLVRVNFDVLTHEQKEANPCVIYLDEEIDAMLAVTAPYGKKPSSFWHAAIAIGRWTGLRLSDIACLEWSCFLTPGKIAVWTRKKDKRVELPLEPEVLAKAIADLPHLHDTYVFPRQRDQAIDPYRRHNLPSAFADVCAACGIFGKSFHGLRATYITRCSEAGIPIDHIRRAVAHGSEEMTRHYIRPWN